MSELLEYQRAMLRVSFALEPSEADLALLGDGARFRMYRAMVRSRLEGMARLAFARTVEAVGSDAFAACFARSLAEAPPASPLLRDVSAAFGEFALRDAALFARAPAHARELLHFELTKWRLGYEARPQRKVGEEGVREFDFEGVPVFNPLFSCLRCEHTVHEPEPRAHITRLFIYRPADIDQVRWYAADPFFFALVEEALNAPRPLAAMVRTLAASEGVVIDEAFVERLSGSVALALERGVLVGSR